MLVTYLTQVSSSQVYTKWPDFGRKVGQKRGVEGQDGWLFSSLRATDLYNAI